MQYLVSILIPTYNRATLLERAVESALKQTYNYIEIIISDNCSTDDTKKVVCKFNDDRIQYFKNESNVGPILNWQLALKRARGDLAVILCDDDYFLENKYIENAVKLVNKYHSVNLVIPDCILGKTDGDSRTHLGLNECVDGVTFFKNFWAKNFRIPVISNVFKVSIALELEPFTDNTILYSDIELWLKLMLTGDVGYLDLPAVYYNLRGDNIVTSLSKRQLCENAKFIKNIREFMKQRGYNSSFIAKMTYELINRYILFVSAVNRLKIDRELYVSVLQEVGCDYSWVQFLNLISHGILRGVRSKMRTLRPTGTFLYNKEGQ